MGKFINLLGQKRGKITIVSRAHKGITKTGNVRWNYICSCGGKGIIRNAEFKKQKGCSSCSAKENGKRCTIKGSGFSQLFRSYIKESKKQNRSFKISKKYFRFLTKQNCYYCGSAPTCIRGEGDPYVYNGVDRKDNGLGYVKNNVVSCCKICNLAKRNMPYTDFMNWIHKLINYRKSLEKTK